uniref:Putative tick kunitz 56 n=1 Tax=Ixodes ricinus TaxID=34613 RepID=A0A6B0U4C3_IXORI
MQRGEVLCIALQAALQCSTPQQQGSKGLQQLTSSCTTGVPLRKIYYFNNGTNRCERDYTCAKGVNHFEDLVCCMTECPYGNHHPPGKRGSVSARGT